MSRDATPAILRAATRRFARHGFAATSLQAIAEDVGCRKQSLLHHFPSKGALREAVLVDVAEHWNRALPTLLVESGKDRPPLESVFLGLVEFFQADPDRARLIVRELLDRPAEMKDKLRIVARPWVELAARSARRHQAEGTLDPRIDPEAWITEVLILTVSTLAATGVIAELVSDREDAESRLESELFRIVRASLFNPAVGNPAAGRSARDHAPRRPEETST